MQWGDTSELIKQCDWITDMRDVELTLEVPQSIADEPLWVRPYHLSVEQYHQMIDSGVFLPHEVGLVVEIADSLLNQDRPLVGTISVSGSRKPAC